MERALASSYDLDHGLDRHRAGPELVVAHIRRADEGDTESIAELGSTTFYDTYSHANDLADITDYIRESFAPATIADELATPDTTFFLMFAADDPDPVGYAKLRTASLPEASSVDPGKPEPVELQRIYLRRASLGVGLGTLLLRHCLHVAMGAGHETMWLGVDRENHRAIRFYEHLGFEVVGEKEFVLGRARQIDLVMAATLDMPKHLRLDWC